MDVLGGRDNGCSVVFSYLIEVRELIASLMSNVTEPKLPVVDPILLQNLTQALCGTFAGLLYTQFGKSWMFLVFKN